MKLDSETIISGALSGFLSGVGAIIAVSLSNITLLTNVSIIVVLPLVGAIAGVLTGKYIWKKSEEYPGVVDFSKSKTKKRLPGEVFMVELLEKPVSMIRDENTFSIAIDRNNVQELAISTKAKGDLSKKFIGNKGKYYRTRDKEIHKFLSGCSAKDHESIQLNSDYKLRWASGGVLSVVTFNDMNWIPLFFRDIRPYGWNIALGSSERHFNEKNMLVNNLEYELTSPDRFICREFIEETLIVKGKAQAGANDLFHIVMPFGKVKEDEKKRNQFESGQLKLRKKYDNMEISRISDSKLNIKTVTSSMSISINKESPLGEVLVCFSLLDLGIEVVKLFKYNVGNECEFLDGEILEKFDGKKMVKELTRMPVALLSCEFLDKVFSKDITEYDYTIGINPSIKIQEKIPPEHIHIFEWDVMKRLRIVKGSAKGIGSEEKRYTDWYDKFGDNFFDLENKLSKKNPSRLFTPAAAKLLNLFFRHIPTEIWKEQA